MPSSNRVVLSPSGRLLLVKEAPAGAAADRLRREAEVLRDASHAGVAELVDVDELEGGGVALATAFVVGGTLGDAAAGMDPAGLVSTVAKLATTLADLHDRGIVHGRVSADHVLVGDGDGGPVLCGLADARLSDDPVPTASDGADDREALADLIQTVIVPGADPLTDALRQAVEPCRAAAGEARPSLRSLGATLAGLVPDPVPGTDAHTASGRSLLPRRRPAPGRRPGPRTVALAGSGAVVVGGLVAMAFTVGGGRAPGRPEIDSSAAAAPSSSSSTTAPPPTTTVPPLPTTEAPVRVFPRPECPPVTPPGADVDGNGCLDEVELGQGVVAAAGSRWQVGAPGDLVVVGDWDCDGLATPAVVRPSSGHVWSYPRWAEAAEEVEAEPVDVVPAPVTEARVVGGARPMGTRPCDRIEVVGAGGERRIVRVGA